jgi:uncharacterized membrane protein
MYWTGAITEALGFLVSVLLVVAYHIYLHRRVRRDPGYAVHAVNARVRARWVETVITSGRMDVLAVQTLRNSVMAASFMASTSILLIMGVLTLSSDVEKMARLWQTLSAIGSGHSSEWMLLLNVMLLAADFFGAFYFYSMAVRYYNHVGYLISVPVDTNRPESSHAYVAAYLNRAGHNYSLGMRTFFFSLPLVFWFFGSYFMIGATVALILALHALDRAPDV